MPSALLDEMCLYANSHGDEPFHVTAYLLWRTSWIHPFYDGNGRVSRELCHLALLAEFGDSWAVPLPKLLDSNVDECMSGLETADRACGTFPPNVRQLESMLFGFFIDQAEASADKFHEPE